MWCFRKCEYAKINCGVGQCENDMHHVSVNNNIEQAKAHAQRNSYFY